VRWILDSTVHVIADPVSASKEEDRDLLVLMANSTGRVIIRSIGTCGVASFDIAVIMMLLKGDNLHRYVSIGQCAVRGSLWAFYRLAGHITEGRKLHFRRTIGRIVVRR
jgi:hypothetical protein